VFARANVLSMPSYDGTVATNTAITSNHCFQSSCNWTYLCRLDIWYSMRSCFRTSNNT